MRRSKATWVLDGIERTDPSSLEVLELLRDEYPRGTRCVQYL